MIEWCQPKEGLLADLLGGKKIEFDPDLTIIMGRNGAGKSLLMKTLARYMYIDDNGGWSSLPAESLRFSDDGVGLKEQLDKQAMAGSILEYEWDGLPVYRADISETMNTHKMWGFAQGGKHPFASFSDCVHLITGRSSDGERTQIFLKKWMELETPDLMEEAEEYYKRNKDMRWGIGLSKVVLDDLKARAEKRKERAKPTILLDEPDKNLDFINQYLFHLYVVRNLVQKYQVVIATHSPFAFFHEEKRFLKHAYFEEESKLFKDALIAILSDGDIEAMDKRLKEHVSIIQVAEKLKRKVKEENKKRKKKKGKKS